MLRLARRFKRAQAGLAAVEFALILPILIAMLFGMGELSLAVFCRTDVASVASTVADLIAQENVVPATDLTNVYNAANTIMYPYYPSMSPDKPTIRITSVIYDTQTGDTNSGRVAWTCLQSGSGSVTARSPGDRVRFSQPLMAANGSVLMAEVAYNYASPTTQMIAGSVPMTSTFYTKPRRVAQLPAPTPLPGSCRSS